jgi:hypothetical protein
MSQIVLFVPSISLPGTQINVWISSGSIFVAINHSNFIPTYDATFVLNSNVFDSIYRSMGYSTANAFTQASISPNVPLAPFSLTIPGTAFNSLALSESKLSAVYNSLLNSRTTRAIK